MKYKLILGLALVSLAFGCNSSENTTGYILEDTWGETGNWGPEAKIAANPATQQPKKEEPKKAPPKKEEPKKPEAPKEVKKAPVKEEPAPVQQPEETTETETLASAAFESERFNYAVSSTGDWIQKSSAGPVEANFVKNIDGNSIKFSVGVIKNLKADGLNAGFKQNYVAKLAESFNNLSVVANMAQDYKGKKAWTVNYTFEKDGKTLQQRQTFIPHKNNVIVLNWVSTEDGFFKGEADFIEMSNNVIFM